MSAELRRAGLDVSIATTDADGPGRLPVGLGSVREYGGVPVIFFRRQFSDSFKFSKAFARWLAANVPEFDAVHIHGVFSHSCLAAARACRRGSIPYIVRPLGALERWSLRQKPVRKRVALALGAARMLRNAAAIHYTTERERRESEEMLGLSKGVVIPLGVDPPNPSPLEGEGGTPNLPLTPRAFHARPSPAGGEGESSGSEGVPGEGWRPYILFLSRLHPKKGVEILIEAFARVVKLETRPALRLTHRCGGPPSPPSGEGETTPSPDAGEGGPAGPGEASCRLIIAGSGEPAYESSLRRLAESLGIADRVVFVGWLDSEAKAAALASAALFVLPSAQENFGLSVLEAMAAGVPVAVSREVDLSDEVEAAGAGWVFERSPASLADVLREVLSDEEERRSRGRRGRALVEQRYLWPGIAVELESLYRTVTEVDCPSSPPRPPLQHLERGGDSFPLHMVERGDRRSGG